MRSAPLASARYSLFLLMASSQAMKKIPALLEKRSLHLTYYPVMANISRNMADMTTLEASPTVQSMESY